MQTAILLAGIILKYQHQYTLSNGTGHCPKFRQTPHSSSILYITACLKPSSSNQILRDRRTIIWFSFQTSDWHLGSFMLLIMASYLKSFSITRLVLTTLTSKIAYFVGNYSEGWSWYIFTCEEAEVVSVELLSHTEDVLERWFAQLHCLYETVSMIG
jgi:hypothetical protein